MPRMFLLLLVLGTLPLSGYLEATNDFIGWDKAPHWLTIPEAGFSVIPEKPTVGDMLTIAVKDSIAFADVSVSLQDRAERRQFVVLWNGKSNDVGDFVVTTRLEAVMKDEAGRTLELLPGHEYSVSVSIDRSRMRGSRRFVLGER